VKARKPETPTIIYNPEWTPEVSRDRLRWIENASRGLRVTGPVHEVMREAGYIRGYSHGYYCDSFQDSIAVGYVLQLPARDGAAQYVPAIADPYNPDCYVVDFHSITDDKTEAARDADSMAEHYAEREREVQAKDMAEHEAEELREEIAQLRSRHSAAVRELRSLPPGLAQTPLLCSMLRESLASMRRDVRKARERIAALADNFWLATPEGC
jgi:hypothetical protein